MIELTLEEVRCLIDRPSNYNTVSHTINQLAKRLLFVESVEKWEDVNVFNKVNGRVQYIEKYIHLICYKNGGFLVSELGHINYLNRQDETEEYYKHEYKDAYKASATMQQDLNDCKEFANIIRLTLRKNNLL